MFKQIADGFRKTYQQETLAERSTRIKAGALYSALAAAVYITMSAVINVLFYTNLHLAIDWGGLVIRVLEYGAAMAVAGAIVGWFTEDHEGIVWGGLILAILLLLGSWVISLLGGKGLAVLGESIITIIPAIAASVLLAWVIRMAIKRYVNASAQEKPSTRRKQTMQLTITVIVVGLILGVFSMLGLSAVGNLRSVNENLQNYASDPLMEKRFPYQKLPGLKEHLGTSYSIYVHPSIFVAGSMDVTIRFKDGYAFTCLIPQTSSSDSLLLDNCNEGTRLRTP